MMYINMSAMFSVLLMCVVLPVLIMATSCPDGQLMSEEGMCLPCPWDPPQYSVIVWCNLTHRKFECMEGFENYDTDGQVVCQRSTNREGATGNKTSRVNESVTFEGATGNRASRVNEPVTVPSTTTVPDPKRCGRHTFFASTSTCRPVTEVENRVSDNLSIIIIKSVLVNAVAFLAIFFYALCISRVK